MEKMKTVVIFFLLSSLFVADVLGYCYADISDMVNKCKALDGHEFEVGEQYVIPGACERCDCLARLGTNAFMSCCGYGIRAGTIGVPSGYKVVGGGEDGCEVNIVKISDGSPF